MKLSKAREIAKEKNVPTEKIEVEEDLVARPNGLDEFVVDDYREKIRAGEEFPPIMVNEDFTLVYGWHRYEAYKKEGREKIKALVADVSEDDILEMSARENITHGESYSPSDVKKLAKRFDEEGKSKEEIADILKRTESRISQILGEPHAKRRQRKKEVQRRHRRGESPSDIAKDIDELAKPTVYQYCREAKEESSRIRDELEKALATPRKLVYFPSLSYHWVDEFHKTIKEIGAFNISYPIYQKNQEEIDSCNLDEQFVFGDSGGFQQAGPLEPYVRDDLDPVELVRWQDIFCDIGVLLDKPPYGKMEKVKKRHWDKCIEQTRKNYEKGLEASEGKCELLAVLHGKNEDEWKEWWRECVEPFLAEVYGVAFPARGSTQNPKNFAEGIKFLKEKGVDKVEFLATSGDKNILLMAESLEYFEEVFFDSNTPFRQAYNGNYTSHLHRLIGNKGLKIENYDTTPCNCVYCQDAWRGEEEVFNKGMHNLKDKIDWINFVEFVKWKGELEELCDLYGWGKTKEALQKL